MKNKFLLAERDRYQESFSNGAVKSKTLCAMLDSNSLLFDDNETRIHSVRFDEFANDYAKGLAHRSLDRIVDYHAERLQRIGNKKWLSNFSADRICVAYLDCFVVVPALTTVKGAGHIILFPSGFMEALALVNNAFEISFGYRNLVNNFPRLEHTWASPERVSDAFDYLEEGIVRLANQEHPYRFRETLPQNLELQNTTFEFILVHELAHAIHWYSKPVGLEHQWELRADRDAFDICLGNALNQARLEWEFYPGNEVQFEEEYGRDKAYLYFKARDALGQNRGRRFIKKLTILQHIAACNMFFATVHVLTNTLGEVPGVKKSEVNYPTPTERSKNLRKSIREFSNRRDFRFLERYLLKRFGLPYLGMAEAFVEGRGKRCVERLLEAKKLGWDDEDSIQSKAFDLFSY